jgi:uncharacterized protein (DUF2062 family)
VKRSETGPSSRRLPRVLRWLVRLRGSPEAIGRGVAIGMVVSFTPTIGFQTVIVLFLATLLNANRPVSVVPTWITNPLTIPPIFAFNYWVGTLLWPGPPMKVVHRTMTEAVQRIATLDFWQMYEQLMVFVGLSLEVFIPLMIGGLVVGGVCAAISYPLTVRAVRRYRQRRRRATARRRARRATEARPRSQ